MVIRKIRGLSNRVLQNLELEYRKGTILPFSQLSLRFPNLLANPPDVEELKKAHQEYVSAISSPEMAASFELSRFLLCAQKELKVAKAVDLGSGFTSFILRRSGNATTVWSVDDDERWLAKTAAYLSSKGVSTSNLCSLSVFIDSGESDFDLIVLDLNYVEVRKNYIDLVLKRCAPGGMVVFDDVHKPHFRLEVLRHCKGHPVELYDLKPVTTDQYGRYAMFAIKTKE